MTAMRFQLDGRGSTRDVASPNLREAAAQGISDPWDRFAKLLAIQAWKGTDNTLVGYRSKFLATIQFRRIDPRIIGIIIARSFEEN